MHAFGTLYDISKRGDYFDIITVAALVHLKYSPDVHLQRN